MNLKHEKHDFLTILALGKQQERPLKHMVSVLTHDSKLGSYRRALES